MGFEIYALTRCLHCTGFLLQALRRHCLQAQAPLTTNPEVAGFSQGILIEEQQAAADRALQSGLIGLAERLYADC